MNKNKLVIFICAVLAIYFIGISIYLIVPFGNTAVDIIETYNELSATAGQNVDKKLMFVIAYTKVTGDITVAKSLGMSEQEIAEAIDPEIPDIGDEDGGGGDEGDPGGPELTGDIAEQVKALQASGSWAPYYVHQLIIDSSGLYHEKQSSSYNKIKTGGSDVGAAGCYIYALCQARTYITGKVFTTLDFAKAFGLTATVDKTGSASGYLNISGVGKGKFAESTVGMNVAKVNLNSMTDGKYYIIYGYSSRGIDNRTGVHWRVCQKDSSTGKYFILPNCGQDGRWVNEEDFKNLYSNGGQNNKPAQYIFEASYTGG